MNTRWIKTLALRGLVAITLAASFLARGQTVTVLPDHTNGVYDPGQTIQWRIEATGATPPASVNYTVKKGGLTELTHGTIELTNGAATVTATLNEPGTLLTEVRWGDSRGQRALGGAVVSPSKISTSSTRPADFKDFWRNKIAQLEAVPALPKLDSAPSGKTNVDFWKITLNNIHETHIQGQLARPSTGEKFPALLLVQYAGVYALNKNAAVSRASEGWLVLNIEAHDIPIDESAAFYAQQNNGPLRNYPTIGNDDRETSYFLRMYLSCYRAAQYLTERPDWDGKTLVVTGDSQGGMQTLMLAGFHPKITAALALVPAGCDMLGPDVGRKGGWPQWYDSVGGKDAKKVREASRYFDVANFTPDIKVPVLVGLGLIDETCPPAGVLAAVNQITSPKEIIILTRSGHQDTNGSQAAYRRRRDSDWLPALQKGTPPPLDASSL